jgi:hypothetical protein
VVRTLIVEQINNFCTFNNLLQYTKKLIMARVNSAIKISGKVDDKVHVNSKHGHLVRKASKKVPKEKNLLLRSNTTAPACTLTRFLCCAGTKVPGLPSIPGSIANGYI